MGIDHSYGHVPVYKVYAWIAVLCEVLVTA